MLRLTLAVLGVMTMAACGAADPPAKLPSTLDATSLPAAARAALDQKWPKAWEIATLSSDASTCLTGKPMATVITSDFDSDGSPDLAAAVNTPQGIRLVVMLDRMDHYAAFDIDSLGDKGATSGLGLEKRGSRFVKAATLFQDFYPADTLTAYGCGGVRASYLWGGLTFYKVDVAPAAKP